MFDLIFRNTVIANLPLFAAEFSFNADSLKGATGASVARLVLEQGWSVRLFDGEHENPAMNMHRDFLTSANAVEVFRKHGVPPVPD